MPGATLWPSIGAVAIVALFCVSAVVYFRRNGSFLPKGGKLSPEKKLTNADIASGMFVCVAVLVAVVGSVVAPTSAFGLWIQEPSAWPVYAVWCWFMGLVILLGPRVVANLRGER
jgi:hypothetical protein